MKTIVALVDFTDALIGSLARLGMKACALQFKAPVAETPKLNADLIIMGAQHHCALYNFFVGSTAAEVLKRAAFPMLMVPCDGSAQVKK